MPTQSRRDQHHARVFSSQHVPLGTRQHVHAGRVAQATDQTSQTRHPGITHPAPCYQHPCRIVNAHYPRALPAAMAWANPSPNTHAPSAQEASCAHLLSSQTPQIQSCILLLSCGAPRHSTCLVSTCSCATTPSTAAALLCAALRKTHQLIGHRLDRHELLSNGCCCCCVAPLLGLPAFRSGRCWRKHQPARHLQTSHHRAQQLLLLLLGWLLLLLGQAPHGL